MASDFLGKGWAFPVGLSQDNGFSYVSGEEKIRQSIWLILTTAPGERQMRPTFGCGIHDLAFQPNTAALRGLVQEEVREALVRWEPRIDVLGVRVETPLEAQNFLLIRIDYRIRSHNAIYNLVYPFYLTEGVS